MKILIVSDTHGHSENLEKVLEQTGPLDHFIHLGDVEGQEDYIEVIAGCPVHMVSGNNDFFLGFTQRRRVLDWRIPYSDYTWTLLRCFCGDRTPKRRGYAARY